MKTGNSLADGSAMRQGPAILAFLAALGVAPALADDVVSTWEDPRKPKVTDCEGWKSDWEIRCLSEGGGAAIGGTVTLTNTGAEAVAFATQVWKSACGFPSGGAEAKAEWLLPPGGSREIELQSNIVGAASAPCTELFVFECKAGGSSTRCKDHLHATLSQQTAWPEQPLRDCALQDGTTFYCPSWSLKSGATYLPGPVHLQRKDSSTDLLVVRPQEWQSVCGSAGSQNAHPPVYLRPGENAAVSFIGYTGEFANVGDLCVEMFIGNCVLVPDGEVPQQVNCADRLRVTVQ